MAMSFQRREVLNLGSAVALAGAALAGGMGPAAAASESLLPAGASALMQLSKRLEQAPRRRDFKSVPINSGFAVGLGRGSAFGGLDL